MWISFIIFIKGYVKTNKDTVILQGGLKRVSKNTAIKRVPVSSFPH